MSWNDQNNLLTLPKPANAAWQNTAMPVRIKLRRFLRPALFALFYPLQIFWNRKSRQASVAGIKLSTDPRVFHPGQHFSSKILANYVAGLTLSGSRLLDMGSGSGVIGVVAARQGAEVVAIDINPRAAWLSKRNARVHQAGKKMNVLCGDLFDPLARSTPFDWIVFNPPFFPRAAKQALEMALHAGDGYATIARFLNSAKPFLTPSGKILMILSSDMDLAAIAAMFDGYHYHVVRYDLKPHLFEMFYLIELMPRQN
jgi:release factor glutamine methyltransferase